MKLVAFAVLLVLRCDGQWTEMEVRRMLENTNQRHLLIEIMTKEAAARQNMIDPNGETLSKTSKISNTMLPSPIESTTPSEVPVQTLPKVNEKQIIVRPGPPPSIEDDRAFLAKMTEQEARLNQIDPTSTSQILVRNELLERSLNMLRPLIMPVFGGPLDIGNGVHPPIMTTTSKKLK
ncbi:unnamed protein product [Caenorhabditis brenneri]